jgi:hypothetical protein
MVGIMRANWPISTTADPVLFRVGDLLGDVLGGDDRDPVGRRTRAGGTSPNGSPSPQISSPVTAFGLSVPDVPTPPLGPPVMPRLPRVPLPRGRPRTHFAL